MKENKSCTTCKKGTTLFHNKPSRNPLANRKLPYQITTQYFMHHLSSSHLRINKCSICAKSVIKKLMQFYLEVKEKDGWNGQGVSLDHGVVDGVQPNPKISQTCITS